MKTKLALVVATAGLLLAARPLVAHHAFAAEFDADKPVKLTGRSRKSSGRIRTRGFTSTSPTKLARSRIGAWKWGVRTAS